MQQLLDNIASDSNFPFKLYSWCLFEVIEKCTQASCDHCKRAVTRDRDGELESFYDICQGKAKRSDGFMLLNDVWQKFMLMDWEVFDAEWLGLRPGRSGQVFKEFLEDVHARRFPVDLGMFKQIAVVMDDGWTDPLAVLFIGRDSRDNLFCFDSLYRTEWPHEDAAEALKKKFDLYGWSVPGRDEEGNEIKIYTKVPLYIDSHAPRTISEFRKLGFDAQPISASVDGGNRQIRTMLTNRRKRTGNLEFLLHPDTCGPMIEEFVGLHYPVSKDGVVTSENYRGHDHLLDCYKYGCAVFGLIEGDDKPVGTAIDIPRANVVVPTRGAWKDSIRLQAESQRRRGWKNTRLTPRYRR